MSDVPAYQREGDKVLHQEAIEEVVNTEVEAGVGLDNPPISDAPVDASVAHALNATFDDTEVEGALDALGGKINAVGAAVNSILDALRANGIVLEA